MSIAASAEWQYPKMQDGAFVQVGIQEEAAVQGPITRRGRERECQSRRGEHIRFNGRPVRVFRIKAILPSPVGEPQYLSSVMRPQRCLVLPRIKGETRRRWAMWLKDPDIGIRGLWIVYIDSDPASVRREPRVRKSGRSAERAQLSAITVKPRQLRKRCTGTGLIDQASSARARKQCSCDRTQVFNIIRDRKRIPRQSQCVGVEALRHQSLVSEEKQIPRRNIRRIRTRTHQPPTLFGIERCQIYRTGVALQVRGEID